jgi:hypothetical protein
MKLCGGKGSSGGPTAEGDARGPGWAEDSQVQNSEQIQGVLGDIL